MVSAAGRFAAGFAAAGTSFGVLTVCADEKKPVARERIPMMGFGTAAMGDAAEEATLCALKCGYRGIDTALLYGSHEAVGSALQRSGVPRDEVYITTKVGFFPPEAGSFGQPGALPACVVENRKGNEKAGVERSLREMKLSYVDLCLIHTPVTTSLELWTAFLPHYAGLFKYVPFFVINSTEAVLACFLNDHERGFEIRKKSWENMLELKRSGLCKAVGVSNYEVKHLEEMLRYTGTLPDVNQIEMHPQYPRADVVKWCNEHGVVVTGYGHHVCFEQPSAPASSTILKWIMSQGVTVIPRSQNPEHIRENFESQHTALTKEEQSQVSALLGNRSYYWNTNVVPTKVSV